MGGNEATDRDGDRCMERRNRGQKQSDGSKYNDVECVGDEGGIGLPLCVASKYGSPSDVVAQSRPKRSKNLATSGANSTVKLMMLRRNLFSCEGKRASLPSALQSAILLKI